MRSLIFFVKGHILERRERKKCPAATFHLLLILFSFLLSLKRQSLASEDILCPD